MTALRSAFTLEASASAATSPPRVRWFYRPVPKARPAFRLFCFPYAGGSPSVFRTWALRVPANVELVGIELPGRGARVGEPPIADMDRLASGAADAIAAATDVQFAFFGHSMGALVAFEVTRRLRSRGPRQPCHLFASGCRAPHLKSDRKAVISMSDEEFLESLRDLNGTPESVLREPELMDFLFPILRADFMAVDRWTYRDERPLSVPITAMGGSADPHVTLDAVRAWVQHTQLEFQFRTFPGDHFFIQPNESELLDLIFRTLPVEAWV